MKIKDLNTWLNEYLDAKLYKASHAHSILHEMHQYYTFKEILVAEKNSSRTVRNEYDVLISIDGKPYDCF